MKASVIIIRVKGNGVDVRGEGSGKCDKGRGSTVWQESWMVV